MADTRRALSALQTLLTDNTAGGISPQDVRDFLVSVYPDSYNVKNHGAVGDASTDDTAAIQDAIDTANADGGGIVHFPQGDYLVTTLTPANGVTLKSGASYQSLATTEYAARIRSNTATVFKQTSGTLNNFEISGFNIRGPGEGTVGAVIDYTLVGRGTSIRNCVVEHSNDEGIYVRGGKIRLENVQIQNCLLDLTRSSQSGALRLGGSDHWISDCEVSAPTGASSGVSDANLYVAAIYIECNNAYLVNVNGELSDVGFVIDDDHNRFSNCRADLNWGHGFSITANAGSNLFSNCLSLSNSQDTDNAYDNWIVARGAGNNQFTGCQSNANKTNKHRYGFNDDVASGNKSYYVNCIDLYAQTAPWKINANSGSAVSFVDGPPTVFTAQDATPSVSQYKNFQTANEEATTITDFLDEVPGQVIRVIIRDANTTIDFTGTNLKGNAGVDWSPVDRDWMECISDGTIWHCSVHDTTA